MKFSVVVNDKAEELHTYDDEGNFKNDETGNDDQILNQGGVTVGENPEVLTNIIPNPTEPVKDETEINDRKVTVTSDGNIKTGPEVQVGDVITYTITWQNNVVDETTEEGKEATIKVVDTFKTPGLEFVAAGFVKMENGVESYPTEIPESGWNITTGKDEKTGLPTITWEMPNQTFGASGKVWVKARVTADAVEEVVNGATVYVGDVDQQVEDVKNPVGTDGSLIVTKIVEGSGGDITKEWHFTVTLSDRTINGLYGEMNFHNGVAEFTLKHGESKTATGLPTGTTYTVTEAEANQDGYTTTYTGDTGTIQESSVAEAVVTNSKEPPPPPPGEDKGNLLVTKTVTGELGDREKEFHFTVTFEPASALSESGVAWTHSGGGTITRSGGTLEFDLKDGESVEVTGLPSGTRYTVVEDDYTADGYTTSSTGETGTIPAGGTARADFYNHNGDNPPPPPPPPPTTPDKDLDVEKHVSGTTGEKDRDFHFRVELSQPLTGQYGDLYFQNGVAEFTLKDGQSVHASGLPDGVTYTVTEVEANQDGYKTSATGATGTLPGRAVFNNSRGDDTDLEVDKTVINGDTNKNFRFRIELSDKSINGVYGAFTFVDGVAEFTLRHGQKLHALGLPAGITYTVTEIDANADGYTTSSVGATGTLVEGVKSLADFINSKPDEPDIPHDDTPETGDNSRLGFWIALMFISLMGTVMTSCMLFGKWQLVSNKGKHLKK